MTDTLMNTPMRQLRQQLHRRHYKIDVEGNADTDAQMSNKHLQVAVVIAQPSPHHLNRPWTADGFSTSYPYHSNSGGCEEGERVEYSIGLCKTPWHK
jgi:hypothetical protein